MESARTERHVAEENSPGKPAMTFQERIIMERQQQAQGEGQSPA
jgi:hypothetical protein